ncbi:MAG: hypothetical protein IKL07_07135 [Clostridium sp.]|nr:hypothetical protein [Clostridium sp.]
MSIMKRHAKKVILVLLLMILYITVYTLVNTSNKGNSYLTDNWQITDSSSSYTVGQLKDATFI